MNFEVVVLRLLGDSAEGGHEAGVFFQLHRGEFHLGNIGAGVDTERVAGLKAETKTIICQQVIGIFRAGIQFAFGG